MFHCDFIQGWGVDFYEYMLHLNPDTKFIYNSRDHTDWLVSLANLYKEEGGNLRMRVVGAMMKFREHAVYLTDFYRKNKDKILLWDMDSEPIDKIIDFLPKIDLDASCWGVSSVKPKLTSIDYIKEIIEEHLWGIEIDESDPDVSKFIQMSRGFDLKGFQFKEHI